MFRMNRKAVSPVVSILLMVAVAVAAAILMYVWSMGLIGTLQTGGGSQTREAIELDEYKWTRSGLTLYLRNLGSANVVVDAVYISGTLITQGMNRTLPVGKAETVILANVPGAYVDGDVYTVKVVTKTGGVFTYAMVYGMRTRATGRPPLLDIKVAPPGYPVVGDFWDLRTYVVAETANGTIATAAKGAIVFLYVHYDNKSVSVWGKCDEHGLVRFRRESGYQNVSFRAFLDIGNSTLASKEIFPEKLEYVPLEAKPPDYSPLTLSVAVLAIFSTVDYIVISRSARAKKVVRKWASVRQAFYILTFLLILTGFLVALVSSGWSFPSAAQYGSSRPLTGGFGTRDIKGETLATLFYVWIPLFLVSVILLVWLLIKFGPVTQPKSESAIR